VLLSDIAGTTVNCAPVIFSAVSLEWRSLAASVSDRQHRDSSPSSYGRLIAVEMGEIGKLSPYSLWNFGYGSVADTFKTNLS